MAYLSSLQFMIRQYFIELTLVAILSLFYTLVRPNLLASLQVYTPNPTVEVKH